VKDVGQHQLLMLLLVMQPDLDDFENGRGLVRRYCFDQLCDGCIDMRAVGGNVGAARTRDQSALRPRMPRPRRDVIRVEKKRKTLVENLVRRIVRHQQKLFEEPSDVRAMPLGRRRIRHRLHDLVFGGERRRACFGLRADAPERLDPERALGIEVSPGARPCAAGAPQDGQNDRCGQ
jgi:hypothetical protein